MFSHRRFTLHAGGLTALLASAVAIAACGSSSSSTTSPAASSSTSGAAGAASIGTAKSSAGTYLTGAAGRALYLWVADSGDKSTCYGACASAWPPVTAKGAPSAGGGVDAADLGTTTRTDAAKQVTYKGHPLYYFAGDPSKGSTNGQGRNQFGAKWWLVAPSGSAITSSGSSSGGSSGGSSPY